MGLFSDIGSFFSDTIPDAFSSVGSAVSGEVGSVFDWTTHTAAPAVWDFASNTVAPAVVNVGENVLNKVDHVTDRAINFGDKVADQSLKTFSGISDMLSSPLFMIGAIVVAAVVIPPLLKR